MTVVQQEKQQEAKPEGARLSHGEIVSALAQLSELESQLVRLNEVKAAQMSALLTDEQKTELAGIEADHCVYTAKVRGEIATVVSRIRLGVLDHKDTVRGQHLVATYVPRRLAWNHERLMGFAAMCPALFDCASDVDPDVVIGPVVDKRTGARVASAMVA